MSEKRTRLSNGDKIAILEAIRIPGYKKEEIIIQQKDKSYQDMGPARNSKSYYIVHVVPSSLTFTYSIRGCTF